MVPDSSSPPSALPPSVLNTVHRCRWVSGSGLTTEAALVIANANVWIISILHPHSFVSETSSHHSINTLKNLAMTTHSSKLYRCSYSKQLITGALRTEMTRNRSSCLWRDRLAEPLKTLLALSSLCTEIYYSWLSEFWEGKTYCIIVRFSAVWRFV